MYGTPVGFRLPVVLVIKVDWISVTVRVSWFVVLNVFMKNYAYIILRRMI